MKIDTIITVVIVYNNNYCYFESILKYVIYLKLLTLYNCVKYLLLLNFCIINIQNVFKINIFNLGNFNSSLPVKLYSGEEVCKHLVSKNRLLYRFTLLYISTTNLRQFKNVIYKMLYHFAWIKFPINRLKVIYLPV